MQTKMERLKKVVGGYMTIILMICGSIFAIFLLIILMIKIYNFVMV
jgi:hypothetical protein